MNTQVFNRRLEGKLTKNNIKIKNNNKKNPQADCDQSMTCIVHRLSVVHTLSAPNKLLFDMNKHNCMILAPRPSPP